MNYSLNINFDPADLNIILATGNNVLLYSITDNGAPVVWAAIRPMMRNNITWQENYEIYASNTQVVQGAHVNIIAKQHAQMQTEYMWTGMAFNTVPAPWLPGNQLILGNGAPVPSVTMGLANMAVVNGMPTGATPVNAVTVMSNSNHPTGYQQRVYVALGTQQTGTISNLPVNGCYGNYGSGINNINMAYQGGRFVVV